METITVSKPVYERMEREYHEAMDWLIRIQMQQGWADLGKWLSDNGIFWESKEKEDEKA